jgi:hypothetical protein
MTSPQSIPHEPQQAYGFAVAVLPGMVITGSVLGIIEKKPVVGCEGIDIVSTISSVLKDAAHADELAGQFGSAAKGIYE